MTAPSTQDGPADPARDLRENVPGGRHLDAMQHNISHLREALGLGGGVASENKEPASARAPADPARHNVSGAGFATFHGTTILLIAVTAIYFGGRWALHSRAPGRSLGAVLALVGLIGLFYGTRRLLRLMHNPPIMTDSDTPTH